MQPQEAGFDWWHAISALGGALFGALSAIGAWIYKAGGQVPGMRLEISAAEQRVEDKIEQMTSHFREYFDGIRRQQDDIKLAVERDFVRKDDFKEFREEYRDDMRDLKTMIARNGHK